MISIVFIVDLPLTDCNNKHILTIVGQFTKYADIYSIPDGVAKTAAKYIYDFILKFRIPDYFLTDQDPSQESEFFQELIWIKKSRTTMD